MTAFVAKPDLSIGAFRVWQRDRDVLLRLWRSEFVAQLLEPIFVILALGLGLGQFVDLGNGEKYVSFLAPGLMAMFPMFTCIFECAWGSYTKLEMQGTFRAVVATPVSVDDVITGEILWGMTRATVNATYLLIVSAVLSPWLHMVHSPWAILAIPLALLPGFMFSAMGMAFASIVRAMSQFSYFFNLIVNPMFWFGGAFFPIDSLPGWAQVLAWFVPLTHVVNLYRGLLTGHMHWSMAGDLVWIVVVTAAFYAVALYGMRRRLIE